MSRRLFWILALVCCFVAVTLILVPSRVHFSPKHATDGQPVEASTEISTEVPQPDLPPAQSSGVSGLIGAGDEPHSTASAVASAPKPASQHRAHPQQSTTTLTEQTIATRQPEVSSQDARRQAEVWSYPPLLQQDASNNFVRAMEKLANAKTEFDRYHALGSVAKSHFIFGQVEEARTAASELSSLDEKFTGEPWRDGSAVYDANLVLGRIAAQEGRMDDAKEYLLKAGRSTGSPVLGSFGPNMSLARDLLQRGERDTVLEFFERCGKFWAMGNEKLTLWSEDVKAGRMPDFGADLLC